MRPAPLHQNGGRIVPRDKVINRIVTESRAVTSAWWETLPMQIPTIVLLADAAVRKIRSAIRIALRILATLKDWAQVASTNACKAYLRIVGVRRQQV